MKKDAVPCYYTPDDIAKLHLLSDNYYEEAHHHIDVTIIVGYLDGQHRDKKGNLLLCQFHGLHGSAIRESVVDELY